ncbi:Vancomycin resistance protein YoaR, contains peptidoglycan-binding and VanW domains [Raineyella antarctica]|uniref:Vancomycin resistance protein YoaR, contains peptidoglycan-binding and VanW domains n=1 Tax=Raineyella antarctica TaxID=1577474 RepID=A0A1G6GFT8_9ACTN|nr:VanW family protein [Raineyella antarctica]SDB80046.1 Vancomycin resistance protein YoaR, contains peptidoglycan-binding and VanW domains [Raineyella antarctica]
MSVDPTMSTRRKRIAAAVTGGVVVLAGATYVAGYAAAGENVPRRVTVAGVDVGGMGREEAIRTLEAQLGPRAKEPVKLTIGDDLEVPVVPADAGVSVDAAATVDATGAGRSWSPAHIWRVLVGGGETAPVLAIDRTAMDRTSTQVAEQGKRDARNAAVAYDDKAKTQIEPAVNARAVEPAAVEAALVGAFLRTDTAAVQAKETEPEVTSAEAEKFRTDWADPAVSGPIRVSAGDAGSFEVTPAMIAKATTFSVKDGQLVGKVDPKRLAQAAKPAIGRLKGVKEGQDATWQLGGGKPSIVPSKDGTSVSRDDLYKAVQPVLTAKGEARKASVAVTTVPAEFTTEDAKKADVAGVIGQFTTNFPHADYRNTNLGLVASKINGYVLLPGETFSMNDVVGQRNAASGFADGWVIQGDTLVKEVGGGVSQGATTIFNAAFLAGLEDVEHHPHSLYFERYPAGREATVYYGSLDLRFRNDTDHAVVIEANRAASSPGKDGALTVKLWGDSPYDRIDSPTPTKSNFTTGTTRTETGPKCTPQSPSQGFTASYYRAFIKGGSEVKRQNYSWKYDPADKIICN